MPVEDAAGRVGLIQGYVIDVTAHKSLEQQLGDVSRRLDDLLTASEGSLSSVDPTDLVRRLKPRLARVAGDFVDVDFELQSAPRVRADETKLELVLVSLIATARDSMLHGGVIAIGTHATALRAGKRAQKLGLAPGDYAVIAVADTGLAVERETKARASVAAELIGEAGAIEFENEPGEGARFRILLPVATG